MTKRWLALWAGGVVFSGLLPATASAIPAWARKYGTSCATCHEAFPRLNAVGEAFRLNGYRFPDDMYVKEEKAVLGQDAYKRVWPDAIWPSDIPGLPPVSFRIRNDWEFPVGKAGRQSPSSTFNFPTETNILGGGTLGDNASFFLEFAVADGTTEAKGWLQFESVFGPDHVLNVKAGDVGKHEFGLLTARTENSLTVTDYLYSSWQMPYPDPAATSFDSTNAFMIANAQPGLEVNGFGSRWRYAVGVVNGNDGSTQDNNSEKDFYFQTAWKFGGLGFDGRTADSAPGSAPPVAGRDDSIIVSLFGYDGAALVTPTGGPDSNDRFWRLGLGGKGYYGNLAVGAGYVLGKNSDPYGALSSKSVGSKCWFVETEYVVYPWLIPSVRYETLTLDLTNSLALAVPGLQPQQDQQRFVASITGLLRANVKVILEGDLYVQNQVGSRQSPSQGTNNDDAVVIRLDVAF